MVSKKHKTKATIFVLLTLCVLRECASLPICILNSGNKPLSCRVPLFKAFFANVCAAHGHIYVSQRVALKCECSLSTLSEMGSLAYSRLAGPQSSREGPVSHLPILVLGSQMPTTASSLSWFLGILTQVLLLMEHFPY